MPETDEIDSFVNDRFVQNLTAQLPSWRNETPPPYLKARIASAIAPPPRHHRGGRLLLVTCACVAVLVALLIVPGILAPSKPAFAEVAKSMKAVKSMSYRSTVKMQHADGTWEHETSQIWIQRYPPAYASRSVSRWGGKEFRWRKLTTGTREIMLNESSGKHTVRPATSDSIRQIEQVLFVYTQPGKDFTKPIPQASLFVSPWETRRVTLDGKPAWQLTRKVNYRGKLSLIRVSADPDTRRVVRCEIEEADRHVVNTDFHYDEPLAPDILRM